MGRALGRPAGARAARRDRVLDRGASASPPWPTSPTATRTTRPWPSRSSRSAAASRSCSCRCSGSRSGSTPRTSALGRRERPRRRPDRRHRRPRPGRPHHGRRGQAQPGRPPRAPGRRGGLCRPAPRPARRGGTPPPRAPRSCRSSSSASWSRSASPASARCRSPSWPAAKHVQEVLLVAALVGLGTGIQRSVLRRPAAARCCSARLLGAGRRDRVPRRPAPGDLSGWRPRMDRGTMPGCVPRTVARTGPGARRSRGRRGTARPRRLGARAGRRGLGLRAAPGVHGLDGERGPHRDGRLALTARREPDGRVTSARLVTRGGSSPSRSGRGPDRGCRQRWGPGRPSGRCGRTSGRRVGRRAGRSTSSSTSRSTRRACTARSTAPATAASTVV